MSIRQACQNFFNKNPEILPKYVNDDDDDDDNADDVFVCCCCFNVLLLLLTMTATKQK